MQNTYALTSVFLCGFRLQMLPVSQYLLCVWYICALDIRSGLVQTTVLSFRANGQLKCLLYKDIQFAVKQAATVYGLDAAWFDTHSLRMSAPTIARAAHVSTTNIMSMGRWKSLPASLLYQAQSTKLNNSILSIVNNLTLFTTEDIVLSTVLASRSNSSTSSVRRFL